MNCFSHPFTVIFIVNSLLLHSMTGKETVIQSESALTSCSCSVTCIRWTREKEIVDRFLCRHNNLLNILS